MSIFSRQALIVACLLIVHSFRTVNALNNTINFHLSPNASRSQTTRHYAIINGSQMVLTANSKYALHNLTEDDHNPATHTLDETNIDINIAPASYEKHLERSSVIYGLTKVVNDSNVNPTCYKQLRQLRRGILRKEPWAMKALDASGTKPSGFVFGQNFWFGSREACGAVQTPIPITLSKNFHRVMHYSLITEGAPFDMDYRVIYLRHNSPWQVEIKLMSEQVIHIGLCLPSACASTEVQKLTADYVERGLFVENDIYDMRPEVMYMKDLKLSESFYERKTYKMVGVCVIFTLAMSLCASLLQMKTIVKAKTTEKLQPVEVTHTRTAEALKIKDTTNTSSEDTAYVEQLKEFVQCFNLHTNFTKMFATGQVTPTDIPVINGLRSVCALWIMAFHVLWFMYFTVNNKAFLISYAERLFFQYVSSAPLLVDVFFTISGFLQTYNFMRNAKKMEVIRQSSLKQNFKRFGKILFHRYLRLAPLYLVIISVVDLLYAYIGEVSVYHINERFDEICSKNWWRNLLFIQNFFDHTDLCLSWTWSLACEMQYFVLATILLFVYAKHPKFVKIVTVVALLANLLWTYAVGLTINFQLSFDSTFATGTEIYINPFVRIMPYILGAMTAWFLIEKQCQLDLSETQEKCCWNLSIVVFFLCMYSTFKRDMSYFSSTSLIVFGRMLYSLSVCWVIVGSATGRGSWWSRILEAKVFQHTNRLSYAIYLVNPFVVAFFFSLTNVSTHADPFMLCVSTSGFAVIVYLTSIVFSLAFEMPYSNWSSQLLRREKLKAA